MRTGKRSYFDGVGSEKGPLIVLSDEIMDLKVGVLLPREDRLMREIRDKKHIFPLLESQRRRLPKDGKHNLNLALFVETQDIAILSHAVDLLLDDDWTG